MITKLILVRHGETDINVKGKMHKVGDPEKLNKKGREQIKKTAEKLKDYTLTCVYTSSEARANESAKIISETHKVPLRLIKGFEERNWGNYSKTSWTNLRIILDKLSYTQRFKFKPPAGESLIEFEDRLGKAVKNILDKNKGATVCIVSHGGAIRVILGFLLELPPQDRFKYEPPNASITILKYQKSQFTPVLLPDTSHLN